MTRRPWYHARDLFLVALACALCTASVVAPGNEPLEQACALTVALVAVSFLIAAVIARRST